MKRYGQNIKNTGKIKPVMGLEQRLKFSAIVHKEDDLYVSWCPDIDIASQGKTIEKAISNLKEAVELYLENEDVSVPQTPSFLTTFEVSHDKASHPSAHKTMELPTAELWSTFISQATEVALAIACPNRSRVAGYNDYYKTAVAELNKKTRQSSKDQLHVGGWLSGDLPGKKSTRILKIT